MTAAWTTEQRVAVALWAEHEPTQDLARWARGETAPLQNTPSPEHVDCEQCRGWGGYRDPYVDYDAWHRCECGCPTPQERSRVPVPDPLDVEAYKADCARRCVDPGPLPSLDYADERVRWWWRQADVLSIAVGGAHAAMIDDRIMAISRLYGTVTPDDLALLARLCKAAAEAMR